MEIRDNQQEIKMAINYSGRRDYWVLKKKNCPSLPRSGLVLQMVIDKRYIRTISHWGEIPPHAT